MPLPHPHLISATINTPLHSPTHPAKPRSNFPFHQPNHNPTHTTTRPCPAPQALRLVRRFRGHTDRISDLQLSADCRWLLSASLDNTVRVWDVPGGCPPPWIVLGQGWRCACGCFLGGWAWGGVGWGLALWHAPSALPTRCKHECIMLVEAFVGGAHTLHIHRRCLFSHLRWHSHSLVDVTRRESTAGHLPLAPRPAACAAGGYTRWPHVHKLLLLPSFSTQTNSLYTSCSDSEFAPAWGVELALS